MFGEFVPLTLIINILRVFSDGSGVVLLPLLQQTTARQ
jgi:hypothetical protein